MEAKEAFKFCLRCGTKARLNKNHLHCPACGLDFYLNPKPVQSVILFNNKNELLFVIRAFEPKKGFLDFPGGFVDEDEDFEQSIRRELKEELGIDIGEINFLSSDHDTYLFQDVNYKTMGATYYGNLPKNAELKPDDDVSGVEFYRLEDIPMDRLAWPSMRRMIEKLKTIKT
jgi:ADP-ribose pyrophosphatase YjhB (NUDIX family)